MATYDELLKDEPRLDAVLNTLKINKTHHRFKDAFDVLREVRKLRLRGESISESKVKHLVPSVVHDLSVLSVILNSIDLQKNPGLLAAKFKRLLTGKVDRSSDPADADARNVQFELLLYSDFVRSGLEASLGDGNPDLLAVVGSRKYGLEAKRLYSSTSRAFERNIKAAAKQLEERFLERDVSRRGIVAISVDRLYNLAPDVLWSQNISAATKFIQSECNKVVNACSRYWGDSSVMRDQRILGLVCVATTIVLEDEDGVGYGSSRSFVAGLPSPKAEQYRRDVDRDLLSSLNDHLF